MSDEKGAEFQIRAGMMVDPPMGWRYGFPREYDPVGDETFDEWLVRRGYPKKHLNLSRVATRFWLQPGEELP